LMKKVQTKQRETTIIVDSIDFSRQKAK